MNGIAFPAQRIRTIGGLVAALAGVTASTQSALGADRMVLGEFFTWVNCPACSVAEPTVDGMVEQYGLDGSSATLANRLAIVTFHLWDGYQVPWGDARHNYYVPSGIFQGTPCFPHDGLYDAWPITSYETNFLNRVTVPTDVTMTIDTEGVTEIAYEVTVETCLDAGAEPLMVRVYTVVAEDHYPINDPDSGLIEARNFFRGAAAPQIVSLTPGECVEVTSVVGVWPAWDHEDLVIIAWAQVPNGSAPAEIHQAAMDPYASWTPPPPPCPWDCQAAPDGSVGVTDFLRTLADWGGGGPCDFDGEGVGVTDFLALLANWGSCPQ